MYRNRSNRGSLGVHRSTVGEGKPTRSKKCKSWIEHDLDHLGNWSLSLDLKIIFLTLFKGSDENAYLTS
jgi:putative colanic acid biosysnthesis UDP-glucose lipid carrier transferase